MVDLAGTWFANEVNVCPLSSGPGESPSGVEGARPPSGVGKNYVGKVDELSVDRGKIVRQTSGTSMLSVSEPLRFSQEGRMPSLSTECSRGDVLYALEYISVGIAESPSSRCFPALIDSGSEIYVVHRRLLGSFIYPVCGHVKLRGIVSSVIIADLTYLTLQLSDNSTSCLRALCAVSN
jgi:hypothetical protein